MKIIVKDIQTNYNVSKESDLSMFFKWIGIVLWLVLFLYLILLFFSSIAVNFISLEDEKKIFWWLSSLSLNIDEEKTQKLQKFLWDDFKYEIVVIKDKYPNAYTLPWWTIAVTDSMLDDIKYENSLLFIIWHEIWHIENRDVFKRLFTDMPIRVILSVVWIWWDMDLSFLLSWTSWIYSKSVESKSDKAWLEFLYKNKQDVWCALYFFEKNKWLLEDINSFLSDHPMTSKRIEDINSIIEKKWYKSSLDCKLLSL